MSTIGEMLRYMDTKQRVAWTIGAICSGLTGLSLPSFALVFGEVVQTFDPANGSSLEDLMVALLKNILVVAAIIWVLAYLNYALMQMSAEQLTIKLRGQYLRSLLKQEVAFFEKNNVEQMPSDIGQYFTKINKGLGDSQG